MPSFGSLAAVEIKRTQPLLWLSYGNNPGAVAKNGTSQNGWWKDKVTNNLKAGDILRTGNDTHNVFITAVNGSNITYTDCNHFGSGAYPNDACKIFWDTTKSISALNITYVLHAPYALSSSTTPGKPTLSVSTAGASVQFSWTWPANTDKFGLRIYNAGGNVIYHNEPYTSSSLSVVLANGSYTADVAAINNNGSYTFSDKISFTVASAGSRTVSGDFAVKKRHDKILTIDQALDLVEKQLPSLWLSPYAPIIDIRLENLVVDNGDGSSAVIPCWHLCIDRKG
ncbi:MAG: hypothetical protein LBJ12_06300, partial [Oscillospiraceae bacterium]|nr:hypothetical protein [Oscillospiraceae bacterium]